RPFFPAAVREASGPRPRRGRARRRVHRRLLARRGRRAVDDDDPLRRPLREGRHLGRHGGDGGGGRAPLRPGLHGRGSHRGLGRAVQRPRGQRVRRIPWPAQRLRRRRGANAGRRRAPAISRGAHMTPETLVKEFDASHRLVLSFAGVPIAVKTNDPEIQARLASYFRPWVISGAPPLAEVTLIQGALPLSGEFVDVQRDGGRRPKEATQEVPGGRLVIKRATGVLIGLWAGGAFAAGDPRTHLNQGVKLINNCDAKGGLRPRHLRLHASAVPGKERAAVLAGPPGAGKSTSALHLVEAGFRCLSNDRVLAKPLPDMVEALGYPKQPRVNPGTLLGHPRLSTLLDPADRADLRALPVPALWDLERKSDVDLDRIYGDGTFELRGRMEALVLLKWRRYGQGRDVRRLSVDEALAALPLVYKNLGAFDLDRIPGAGITDAERACYRELFSRVTVAEVTGRVDFSGLVP